jgi:hypothetical protein
MDRRDAIRERMERDADFLRGAGGHVTTADLRAYGMEMAYAALPSRAEEEHAMDSMYLHDLEMEVSWMFAARHEGEHFRDGARGAMRDLRKLRAKIAAYEATRREEY